MSGLRFHRLALAGTLSDVSRVQPWQRDDRTPGLVRITAVDGIATLTTTAAGMQMQARVACEGEDASFAAPFNAVLGLAEKAGGDTVELAALADAVRFSSGRMTSKLGARLEDAMMVLPAVVGDRITVDAAHLRGGLSAALPATIDDMKRPALGSVFMHDKAGQLTFEAQDGYRFHTAAQDGNRFPAAALIPTRAARIIVAMLDEAQQAFVTVGERAVEVEVGDCVFQASLASGAYPSGKPAIASAEATELRARASDLLSDLDLVTVASDPRLRDFQLTIDGRCEASAFQSSGMSPCRGTVALLAECGGPPLKIGFQYPLVRDALHLFGDDEVVWRMNGPMEASTITSAAHPGVEAIISPCRPAADLERLAA